MATNTAARKSRERRLRAKYRKKTVVTAIITLLVGLILGFALCAVLVSKPGPVSRMLKVGPVDTPPISQQDSELEDSDFGEDLDLIGEDFGSEDEDFASEDEDFANEDADAGEDEDFANEDADANEDEDFGEANTLTLDAGEPTQEATPEPSPTPTPEPTPGPTTTPQIVAYGLPMVIQTEINADGSKRTEAEETPYETLNFTLKVDAYKNPAYFQQNYSTQYKLNGDEAAVQFDITLNGYTGAQQIVPQDALLITFMGATPEITNEGYQLMDAEIAGKTGIAVTPNLTTTLYKRYSYSAAVGDMKYMVVTAYNNGEPTTYWFDIEAPQVVATPEPVAGTEGEAATDGEPAEAANSTVASATPSGLTVGSEGEEVSRLQRALIAKGLLQGSPDGKFGKYTADAVKVMQGRYNMPQTGVADQAFLDRLYADQ